MACVVAAAAVLPSPSLVTSHSLTSSPNQHDINSSPSTPPTVETTVPSSSSSTSTTTASPLITPEKQKDEFRDYKASARQQKVDAFYHTQHSLMSYSTVLSYEAKYLNFSHFKLGVWETLEYLDTFVDDSDPDTSVSQLQHALQTGESLREMYPDDDWLHLTGLIHDLGKILSIACKEPQWATVGDSFPVGCGFSEKCVFPQYFKENPDYTHPIYSTRLGVYEENCGLEKVRMSWGHDEYLYRVLLHNHSTLPSQALYCIRFHSFYPWHTGGDYQYLTNEHDCSMLQWIKKFNQHDLYSKAHKHVEVTKEIKEYYQGLIKKYFPKQYEDGGEGKLKW